MPLRRAVAQIACGRYRAIRESHDISGVLPMIGIIGGTGLYRMAELQVTEVREVSTPFGPPSSPVMLGVLGQRRVAFLARHGLHHDLLPSEINFRGNIF